MPVISFRCSETEYAQIQAAASKAGEKHVGAYARSVLLGVKTPSNYRSPPDARLKALNTQVEVLTNVLRKNGYEEALESELADKIAQGQAALLGGKE